MKDGRDLRNKVICFNNHLYVIGGNNYTAEKYSFIDNK